MRIIIVSFFITTFIVIRIATCGTHGGMIPCSTEMNGGELAWVVLRALELSFDVGTTLTMYIARKGALIGQSKPRRCVGGTDLTCLPCLGARQHRAAAAFAFNAVSDSTSSVPRSIRRTVRRRGRRGEFASVADSAWSQLPSGKFG